MAAPKKQRGLGKGLDALFGDAEVTLRAKTDKNEEENQVKAEEAEAKVEDKEVSSGGIAYTIRCQLIIFHQHFIKRGILTVRKQ